MSVSITDVFGIELIEVRNADGLFRKKITGVSTDSRTVGRGEIFFALRGDAYNGHKFVEQAFKRGAVCAVVDSFKGLRSMNTRPMLMVENTTRALGQLAATYRRRFSIPVLAVAGSNGKTTTKEMISHVLGTKYSVLSTQGNLNNHIGVPQTLFRLRDTHDIAVVEIGTNHFGELNYLCEILQPTHGVITNIGREHMEFFKTLNGVSRAEGELFSALALSGVGFVNSDDRHLRIHAKKLRRSVVYGTSGSSVNVRGTVHRTDKNGCTEFTVAQRRGKKFRVRLSVPGHHAMLNALAATTIGLTFGVKPKSIRQALNAFRAVGKRMEMSRVGGVTILNDTYNANPDSVRSAIATLESMECNGKKIVVLGDMLELGDASVKEHAAIGAAVRRAGFDFLMTFGPMAKKMKSKFHFASKTRLMAELEKLVVPGDIVLVKGSRGMKMEDVVVFLREKMKKRTT